MTIIKDAFVEGRNRESTWEDSESLKKVKLLELREHNIHIFKSTNEMYKRKKIQQISPDTGEVINTFDSICSAAKHIMLELKTKNKCVKKMYQMQGNMRMCMMNGYKSYGYYWKVLSHTSVVDGKHVAFDGSDVINCRKWHARRIKFYDRPICSPFIVILTDGTIKKCPTVDEISTEIGVSVNKIKKQLHEDGLGININGNTIDTYDYYNKMIKRKVI